MKSQTFEVVRYDAEDGKVFDWADLEAHMSEDEEGNKTQEHLYAKTLWLSVSDRIDNYVEVEAQ